MLYNIKSSPLEPLLDNYVQQRAVLYTRQTLPAGTLILGPKEIKSILWENHARLQFIPGKYFFDPERSLAVPAFNIQNITRKKPLLELVKFYTDLQKIIPVDSWLFRALTNVMFKSEYQNPKK